MPFLAFENEFHMYDITPVENLFIEEFMPRAPGDYVKVYLYGLKNCYHPDAGLALSTLSRILGLEESAVLDAYRYWERQGVMRRVSDAPPRYEYINLKKLMLARAKDDDGLYQYRDFNHSLQALFGSDRLLHPAEFQKVYDWVEILRLPQDAVLTMLETHIEQKGSKFNFKTLDKLAEKLAGEGAVTPNQVRAAMAHTAQEYQAAQKVLRRLGMRRNPTEDEAGLMRKWMREWGFETEAVLAACAQTTSGRNPSFAYLDGVLSRLREEGTRSAARIQASAQAQTEQNRRIGQVMNELGVRGVAPGPEWVRAMVQFTEWGFAQPVILDAAALCLRRGAGTLEDLTRTLEKWHALGLTTPEAVNAFRAAQRAVASLAARVLEGAGLERAPDARDRAFVQKWTEMGFSEELILYAGQCALGKSAPTQYANRLLENWSAQGVSTLSQAQAHRDAFSAAQANASSAPGGARALPEQQYTQRTYTDQDLETLFVDITQLDKENP